MRYETYAEAREAAGPDGRVDGGYSPTGKPFYVVDEDVEKVVFESRYGREITPHDEAAASVADTFGMRTERRVRRMLDLEVRRHA